MLTQGTFFIIGPVWPLLLADRPGLAILACFLITGRNGQTGTIELGSHAQFLLFSNLHKWH